MLKRLGYAAQLVNNLTDVYGPAAAAAGTPLSPDMPRSEITKIVTALYAAHGDDIGAALLMHYLATRPADTIYIVDSKRSASGLRALKGMLPNLLIIGVYAPPDVRRQRTSLRRKAMDVNADGVVSDDILERDASVFSTYAALGEAGWIIENDCDLPFRLEMTLLEALQESGVVQPIWEPYMPMQPLRKAPSPADLPSLTRVEYRRALDDFANRNRGHQLVIVQGGNRFPAHYLRTTHNTEVLELKLSGMMKQHPSVIIASTLTARERIKPVRSDGTSLIALLDNLPRPALPFTRHTNNDRRVKSDFDGLQRIMSAAEPLGVVEQEASRALCETGLYQYLAMDDRPIAFLDDILYRGRTLHTAWYLLRLLGLLDRPWKFTTICADRASQSLRAPVVDVLRPGLGYPLENCARTAQGYYDLTKSRFEYRDLSRLRAVVTRMWPEVQDRNPLDREWNRLAIRIAESIAAANKLMATAAAIAVITVHSYTMGGGTSPEALADQRAVGLGWCPAFLSFWDSFISQEEPVGRRESFKREVRRMAITAHEKVPSPLFQDLADIYKAIYPRIWYNNDCLI